MATEEFESIHLYNPSTLEVTNSACCDFVKDIWKETEQGFGFVPFIGAGLSAPSGIPLIWEIESYLRRCIALALGIISGDTLYWNPRVSQWPPFRDHDARGSDAWINMIQTAMIHLPPNRQQDRRVLQEALGAMAEWRTSLLFLSRIVQENRGVGRNKVTTLLLDAPKQEVIDAALREIMKGKQPTLGHRMLASLGGVLRLDLILTTNFDDLLEQAFLAAKNPLIPFGLHLRSELPDHAVLKSQRSLVKMHGDRHSLRADYTLDAIPSERDLHRFLEYLLSTEGREQLAVKGTADDLPTSNHLLMMGFSANERRTRAFIEHACLHSNQEFKVYWICHTARDVSNVAAFTYEIKNEFKKRGKTWQPERSRVIRHTHLGLLFLHLFQSIRRSIPIKGVMFPSTSRLPVPPMMVEHTYGDTMITAFENVTSEGIISRFSLLSELKRRLDTFSTNTFQGHRLIVVSSASTGNASAAHGVTSICAELYHHLYDQNVCCLWIEMNGISSTDDLFEHLLDAANYSMGTENWMPVFIDNDPRSRAFELRRMIRASGRPWTIFLNARERPGANLDSQKRNSTPLKYAEPVNGWLDSTADKGVDGSAQVNSFLV